MIRVITKLPNSEQSNKRKVKTHKYVVLNFVIHKCLSKATKLQWPREKNSTSSDIGITDMAIQTEETTPVKDDINIYKENRPKNMS